MELDHQEGVVPALAEALVEAAGVEGEWEVPALELVPVGSVSALTVGQNCPIKSARPAIM